MSNILAETIKPTYLTLIGTSITKIEAKDDDVGDDGRIVYYIQSGGKDNFWLNPKTGWLTVSNTSRLNRDNFGERYILTVRDRYLSLYIYYRNTQFPLSTIYR